LFNSLVVIKPTLYFFDNISMSIQEQATRELACRLLEEKFATQRNSLYEFLLYYREVEKKIKLDENRHIKLICDRLEDVFYWRTKRLMINVPPRSLKTEIVSRIFPARCLWKKNELKFMGISYSSWLSQDNSADCRAIYESDTYRSVFPRISLLKDDQNTKQHRETIAGWQYYASGATGTITGKWCDIMVIDDPLKPDDAMSDVVRVGVNNNFHNTLVSRLNNKTEGAIVIIMQRLHDDDLCWHLIDLEDQWWEIREKLVIQWIAEDDEDHRKAGESFFEKRFPLSILNQIKRQDAQVFSSQYQQQPTNKETQEFHQERFRYHWTEALATPWWLRIFTTVDPAFKLSQSNDESCIMTAWFIGDKCYILEYTAGRVDAMKMQDKIIYHIRKRNPEKIGIEAFQAQTMIKTFLVNELQKQGLYCDIEEIRQTGDKLSKLRKLVPLYKKWMIYHKYDMETLENQLIKFPRWKHDDIIDALQMLYDMYQLVPNNRAFKQQFYIDYDPNWNPIYNNY